MPPTNKKASVTGTSIYRIEGSKIVEAWSNWNLMSLMEQLGIAMATAQSNPGQSTTAHSSANPGEVR
jgi:hypothetical protein